jgi:hypothetical protein
VGYVSSKMVDMKHMVNRSEIISNFARYDNSTKCETCKDLELQLSHVLNELSSVRLMDLSSKEQDRVQDEMPPDTNTNKQWAQVSYNLQKTPKYRKYLRTTYGTPIQHIPVTANRFETLTSLSTDIRFKKPMVTQVSDKKSANTENKSQKSPSTQQEST